MYTAVVPDKNLTSSLDDFAPPVLPTKITNISLRGTRSRVVPLTNLPNPLEFHVVPPSPMEQTYSPGWPTPMPTSVQEDLSIADPRCSNISCRAFREGFAEDERRTPLLGQLEYGKWTVWFYSFWILVFAAIYVSRLLHDRLRRLKKLPGRRPSLKEKAIAVTRFCAYRRPNNHVTRSIGLRQISYGTLVLLSFSTVFFAILPWPQQRYLRAYSRFGAPPLSVRCALIMSALTPLTVALAGKVNVITWITGVSYTKLNVYHRYISYVIFCLGTVHTVSHLLLSSNMPYHPYLRTRLWYMASSSVYDRSPRCSSQTARKNHSTVPH